MVGSCSGMTSLCSNPFERQGNAAPLQSILLQLDCHHLPPPTALRSKLALVFLHNHTVDSGGDMFLELSHKAVGWYQLEDRSSVLVPTGKLSCIKGPALLCAFVKLRLQFQCSYFTWVRYWGSNQKHPLSLLHRPSLSLCPEVQYLTFCRPVVENYQPHCYKSAN